MSLECGEKIKGKVERGKVGSGRLMVVVTRVRAMNAPMRKNAPSVSDIIMTPSAYLMARTDEPVTIGDLKVWEVKANKRRITRHIGMFSSETEATELRTSST